MSTTDGADADVPAFRYTAAAANEIETTWQSRWADNGTFDAPNPAGPLADGFDRVAIRPHAYVMDMFPYPSGAGLHVGHPLGYIGTDVYARYLRMRGSNVLHTMGFDAFGLPAEQYAVQTGQHPRTTTYANIEIFLKQLRRLGLGHDERRRVATTDPGFYRWTQWIFLKIFQSWYDPIAGKARPIAELIAELDAGEREPGEGTNPFGRPWAELAEVERRQVVDNHRLAYRAESTVNWAPGLGTVLANEEVTADGRSERGNFPVFKKPLPQWMMRITAYADRLVDDLDKIDWPDKVRTMQRNWIGRSTGAHVRFPAGSSVIEVFTTRPDTLFGATYMVLAPEHPLVDALLPDVLAGGHQAVLDRRARDTGRGDRQLPQGGCREVRAGPAGRGAGQDRRVRRRLRDQPGQRPADPGVRRRLRADGLRHRRDHGRARPGRARLGVRRGLRPADRAHRPAVRRLRVANGKAFTGDGPAINSGFLDGMDVATAKSTIIEWLEANGHGRGAVTYRLRDWLFSRQRYWGEPFPIVYDETGLPIAVPESMLPVELPETDDFSPEVVPARGRRLDPRAAAGPADRLGRGRAGSGRRARSGTAARPTRCPTGRARAGTSCATWTRPTPRRWSTRRSSTTGWGRRPTVRWAVSSCTSAVSSTPCCTCCTRGSGTRCSTTWAMSARPSRSTAW